MNASRCALLIRTSARAWIFAAATLPVVGQVTSRVSVSAGGAEGALASHAPRISADGRYVTFSSLSKNLVPGDNNDFHDIFVRDRQTGVTERVSVGPGGVEADYHSSEPFISADGRYVAFTSSASNLVAGDTNYFSDAFVHDRQTGVTERVSLDSGGSEGNHLSWAGPITPHGRYVVIMSLAGNLVAGDTNSDFDGFVRDRLTGTTARFTVDSSGVQSNGGSYPKGISADGRFVSFYGDATNLVAADTNGFEDVFVHDRQTGTTERVNVDSAGAQANHLSYGGELSADGRYVVFTSRASNLVGSDGNGAVDGFVRDRQTGTTELVSLISGGAQANSDSEAYSISNDGRYVTFASLASDLVAGDVNAAFDVFVHDRQSSTTELVSVHSDGTQGDVSTLGGSLSSNGRYVVFESAATTLVPADNNGANDIFVRDRIDGTDFASLCDAGVGGVIPCPCGNPPGGPGRGCNNSSSTGGAILAASGGATLSSDSLVFTTSGEEPTALSIVSQWSGATATGVVFGQGVRCASGTLKRLFSKIAVGGSITAPNFGAGDPSVSARSAAKGDPILSGQSRWYVVYYRDSNVLGGCPATSNFNATQTGQVAWSP